LEAIASPSDLVPRGFGGPASKGALNISKSFIDQGLMVLFLLNNLVFIFSVAFLEVHVETSLRKLRAR